VTASGWGGGSEEEEQGCKTGKRQLPMMLFAGQTMVKHGCCYDDCCCQGKGKKERGRRRSWGGWGYICII